MARKPSKRTERMKYGVTMSFNVALANKIILTLFVFIWWVYNMHSALFIDFSDITKTAIVYTGATLSLLLILNFFFIRRTKALGVLINATVVLVILFLMYFFDLLGDISTVEVSNRIIPISAIAVVDILNSYIALLNIKK